ncbi:Stk1 family PASTA domain-containing Ser/Thr kinase [Actinokineospora globicatena]|uniref:Stk1 family PASTA domain-containing Ser/Thr kinase n=1 Tax=Actinokineospora globicatena TaxID=103729 RepID=UPI0020A33ACE|nr:Stk1 family PASTA domain-containing Ser/Thr kinase [Actinokineospora globicatena]MCP2301231.1 serine/threonine protein kinase [Actinokineospora globicatena]GLW77132.1 serine/threonine protein kinase [Actinokineospora globicatena]GLW83966.1 serine/threonine protein kinase [Actinokineospora globicatena]
MTTPRLLSNRYEIGETIGYGGMSEVHRGRDVRLSREVAVKVLRQDLARDPQFQERFRREAQNAAALNHPAIVAVYDTGETRIETGPLPYIVMEYVDGRTLRDIVKSEGPLPGQRAMEIMADVCAALDFSHRHGIVHRDVKPANVMITRSGAVKVMDFGIARALADGQVAVTQTSAVIGTAQYLSPEQARGETVDNRSDVYATGCVLFELLTGEPPFTGDSPVAVAYQHVREDPRPPSALNPRVSPQLDAIVLKAMSKGAANRYQSAAEMRTDIVRVLSGQRPAAPMVMTDEDRTAVLGQNRQPEVRGRHRPEVLSDDYDDYNAYDAEDERKRKRRKTWLIVLVALVVAALIALLFLLLGGKEKPATADVFQLPDVRKQVEAQANATLANKGLQVVREAVACEQTADGQPGPCAADDIGKVVDTTPAAGTEVRKGDRITIKVGTAPGKVAVPDVAGKTQDEAKQILQDAKLGVVATVDEVEVDDDKQVGKVVETNPPVGQQVNPGTQVKLVIGKGPDTVEVTNLVGQDYETASKNLTAAGFVPQRKDVSSDRPTGEVVDQAPKSGKARKGTTITLSVSKGDKVDIEMPNLEGKSRAEAENLLRQRGWSGQLNVIEELTNDPDEVGKILDQQQQPGDKIGKDATIGVKIGKARNSPTIPTFPTR